MKILVTTLVLGAAFTAHAGQFEFNLAKDLFGEIDHLATKVSFDGQETECLVDTGARSTAGKKSLLPTQETVTETLGGGVSGVESVTEWVNAEVLVGDWSNASGLIARRNDEALPFDCLLGNDFFLNREFSIDFSSRLVADSAGFAGKLFPAFKQSSQFGGHFGFKLEIEGAPIESLFDTGATNTVMDTKVVEAHPENFKFVKEFEVTEGSNQKIKSGIYIAKSLKFGDQEDRNVKVYVIDLSYLKSKIPSVGAIFGLQQMLNRKWYFNNKTQVWGVY